MLLKELIIEMKMTEEVFLYIILIDGKNNKSRFHNYSTCRIGKETIKQFNL